MTINPNEYLVPPQVKLDLAKWPTRTKAICESEKDYEKLLKKHVKELSELQRLHYASNRFALLLIFQGMDAGGKDGAIRHVMSGINPQGCQVFSFKQPSAEELDHDFLWRTTKCLPERGRIGIFNRSYFEEVLVVKVHPEYLEGQGIAKEKAKDDEFWEGRYKSIVEFEDHLYRNGTRILKFFMHLSKDEQRDRFLARLNEPENNWKLTLGDVKERGHWDEYMAAFEACLGATSTHSAPWYVIPADDKYNARLIISRIILETLGSLDLQPPEPSKERVEELEKIRKELRAQ